MKKYVFVLIVNVICYCFLCEANESGGNITIINPEEIDVVENGELLSEFSHDYNNTPACVYLLDPRSFLYLCQPLPSSKSIEDTARIEIDKKQKNIIINDIKKVFRDHFVPGQILESVKIYKTGIYPISAPQNNVGWAYCVGYKTENYNIRLWGNPEYDLSVYVELPYGSYMSDTNQITSAIHKIFKYDGNISLSQLKLEINPTRDYIINSSWYHMIGKSGKRIRRITIDKNKKDSIESIYYRAIRIKYYFSNIPQNILDNDINYDFIYEDRNKGHGNDEDRIDEDNPGNGSKKW